MSAPALDLDQVQRWLTRLHGGAEGWIHIGSAGSGPPGKWRGRFFATTTAGISGAAEYVRGLEAKNDLGIYTRCTTLRERPATGRGGADVSLSFPGFWADVDYGTVGHKHELCPAPCPEKGNRGHACTLLPLPPDAAAARQIIAESGLPEPSLIINSGGGLYPWWFLEAPHLISDDLGDISTLSSRWQHIIKASANRLGWEYGVGVYDLDRVLRIPGTINRKVPGLERRCETVEDTGVVYQLDELATVSFSIDLPEPEHTARTTPAPRLRPATYPPGQVGPLTAFAEVCEPRDLLEPQGFNYVRGERDGAELWKYSGSSPASEYSVRAWPHVLVNHSETAPLPVGAGYRLTPAKVFAHWYHGGIAPAALQAAAKDLVLAAAGSPNASAPARALPQHILDHIRQRCAIRPWQAGGSWKTETPWPTVEPTEHDDDPTDDPEPAAAPADLGGDVRKTMAAASEDTIWAGVFPETGHLYGAVWTIPGSDDRPALLPPFPLHTLPGDTGKFVQAVAVYTQTPPEIAAFATIGALSTAVGSHATISGQWTEETLALFLSSIADSGDGKSRAFKAVNAPIYRLESALRRAWDAEYGENAEQLEIAQAARDKIIKDLASAHGDKRRTLLADLDTLKDTIKELTGPPRPQLLVGDVLPEALARLMHRVGGHIGIISAEGTFLGNICGRYNNGKPNLEFVLTAWDASEPWRPDRISRDSFELERPSLALSLSVQPVVIDDAISSKSVTDKGLLNRFLLARPASLAGNRDVRPPHIPAYLSEAWDACVRRAFYAVCPEGRIFDDDGAPAPPTPMQVGEDAEQLMLAWRERHERRLDPDTGDLVCIKGWMSRAAGNAYRLAAILHLAGGHDPQMPVGAEVMTDALAIVDYCIPHAIAILGGIDGGGPRGQVAWLKDATGHVLAWIRRKGMGEFTADQARAGLRGRGWVKEHGAPGVRAVLLALTHEGWLASVTRVDAAGRRLSDPLFVVHPSLLGGGV
ncbi:YfjI family protein [Streptosporangium sp. V21-05]|uniref:YfjI family protein n=1 Tax=Streptosporangium sp. V21-05 TaxID=3446115 RepID=UPI003F52DB9E